jgi:hypothetical protein
MDSATFAAARDSMAAMRSRGDTAGMRAMRERLGIRGGGGFQGGGRRGGGGAFAPGDINLRPSESPTVGPQGEGGRGGFGGFGRGGNAVEPGDYLVTITANGEQLRQVVRVERVGDIVENPFGFGDDEEEGQPINPDPIDP